MFLKYESAITSRRMPGHIREFNRLEPHSGESRWVIDMSAASYKMTEMIPSTSAHLIDRSEDVVFELVWVKSVTDSAVLHRTTRLMVFPRKSGLGRYMVTRASSQYVTLNCVWQLRFLITDEGLCIMSPNVCWKISRVSGKPCSIELMTSPDHTFSIFKQVPTMQRFKRGDHLFMLINSLCLSADDVLKNIIIWLCLTRIGNYQIHEFDWLKWILTAV